MVDDSEKIEDQANETAGKTAGEAPKAAPGAEVSDADFEKPVRTLGAAADAMDVDALIVNLDGYEGPLDILLEMARAQKVDIRKISMVALVEQYLTFIEAARQKNLELAADYLVM
ncbi:MAG: hypothetical protein AAFY32_01765, partial [Pseudomonadota bacterium]